MAMLRGRDDSASQWTSQLLLAKHNGAIDMLVPVEDKIAQVLQLFQSQLLRSVRHVAGLNPRAFRYVDRALAS